ncbi:carbohydrate-binding module family 18 [Xylaria telfairii]|nr:carbohydrate-binding module family 18 [Xylaria telfairii]
MFQGILIVLISYSLVLSSALPQHDGTAEVKQTAQFCRSETSSPFDYSAKERRGADELVCASPRHSILARQKFEQDDYSCSESKPCSNGACCSKKTGYCNYGPEACGTNGQSPNDVCWSNCDAKAECGRYAAKAGQECPLNVCCSQFGFCGLSREFCKVTDDKETSCQSNCDQPGSGSSGGDVQKRIIGYYEAWVAQRKCNGMSISQIPVNALTHLHFAFAYIVPGSYEVVPMDGVDEALLSEFTGVKSKNPGLKAIISIGGWTFSDNGTATQPLFGEIVSNTGNRKKFISNLLSFMRQYAFDGVDFDWEYPGATDRGGQKEDGANFVTLLKELRQAFDDEPGEYSIAFTAPTSYWYLRNFDLSAVDHVDWINIMSYDLHGVWDAQNPIGNNVLAHTNITEIKLALDLLWRNEIPASKINLGLGFYGRSFQLSDPSCTKPGCQFKGGASPGPCTANSGTLAYFEIMDLIDEKNLKPYYDKDAQAKYIVWDNDQWVSYDDEDTFKAKIDFANKLGLGGLLIWSIDQDTQKLDALKAVLGNKGIDAFKNTAKDTAYWQGIAAADCYVTDCGGKCKAGFLPIETQPCGSATPVFRHSSKDDSTLCCPIGAAPKGEDCTWRGSAPSCNGHCENNEVAVELNRWGDGKYCEDGNKAYCCKNEGVENTCYWTGVGSNCNSGDLPLTFAGTFLETIADIASFGGLFGQVLADALDGLDMDLRRLYCCSPDMLKQWENCGWHGKPGSCFDNHCDIGHQVQLTQSDYGAGESCAPRLERTRVFCCDPPKGKSPFLPVPLDYLFPNPPTGDSVDTDFDLMIDDTWGSGSDKTAEDNDPDEASFGFWVMTSPEEIQTSLDKRDGSHWELYNCHDAESEEAQTVQMVCMDLSKTSNCHKIGLGHGVPGTILEMPKGQGCGPSKYAVAVSMEPSKNQTLPTHLRKRVLDGLPVVYDLTFDYDWKRVPRDLGDTQVRVDYSNEVGYWDSIVDKAASKKRKRSLDEMKGNHRRWLEEEWRDDLHFGGLSTEEFHKRWFGSDVIDWLRGLLNVNIKPTFHHDYEDSVTAIIIQDRWDCMPNAYTKLHASLEAKAVADIKISSSFGMTIMFNLGDKLDLSKSYVFLQTSGEVSAIFTVDAIAKADFDSKEFPLATLPFPGASFSIPKLLDVGPKFVLNAQAEASIQLAGHLETKVEVASWDFRQTYPQQTSEFDPKPLNDPQRDFGTKGLQQPIFNLTVVAEGQLTAYLRPTLSFGIEFDKRWDVPKCTAELVAEGWVRGRAKANILGGDATTCPFMYGLDAGAMLIARADVPPQFDWNAKPMTFFPIEKNIIPGDGSDWKCVGVAASRMSIDGRAEYLGIDAGEMEREYGLLPPDSHFVSSESSLIKRGLTYGPFFKIPSIGKLCPMIGGAQSTACNDIKGWTEDQLNDPTLDMKKRSVSGGHETLSLTDRGEIPFSGDEDAGNFVNETAHVGGTYHLFEKRGKAEIYTLCDDDAKMPYKVLAYPSGTTRYDNQDWSTCNNFNLVTGIAEQNGHKYVDEHILERQMLKIFAERALKFQPDQVGGRGTKCKYLNFYWGGTRGYIQGVRAWDYVAQGFPNNKAHGDEMVILEEEINLSKERAFKSGVAVNDVTKMTNYVQSFDNVNIAIKNLKDALLAVKYMRDATINGHYLTQGIRIGQQFASAEMMMQNNWMGTPTPYTPINLQGLWLQFMRDYTNEVIGKFEDFLNLWSGHLVPWLPAQGAQQTPDQMTLTGKITAIRTEIDAVTAAGLFPNPF